MSDTASVLAEPLKRTPLFDQHVALGARMVAFAGYAMPVQYPGGILEEHAWTRTHAGLFDISHMGEAHLVAEDGRHETVAPALEQLAPCDALGIAPGRQRYTQLLNDAGGMIDDLMVARGDGEESSGRLVLILNAARKDVDCRHIAARLRPGVHLELKTDRALLALQGPKALDVMARVAPRAVALSFMEVSRMSVADVPCLVSRSGYTGEDGFEISMAAADALPLWRTLLQSPEVKPCGLGARDSLRLEAGLCLYGHELDETTSPVEAGLAWSIPRRRRDEGGFPSFDRIRHELVHGPSRVRVALRLDGRVPARQGAEIQSASGEPIGVVTSGGFSPTLKVPIAMGYVSPGHAAVDSEVRLIVRASPQPARVVKLPFVAHAYRRAT